MLPHFSVEEDSEDRGDSGEEDTEDIKKEKEEEEEELPVEFPDTVVEMSHIGGDQWV